MKERYNSLDLVRILACVSVLSYHLYKKSEVLTHIDHCVAPTLLVLFFVMMGFLTSAPNPGEDGVYSYCRKKIIHLGMPLVVFTIFYSYIYFQQPADLFSRDGARYLYLGLRQSAIGIFSGPAINQLWFLYDLLALYIIWPFVKAGLDAIGEEGRKKLLILILLIQLALMLYFLKTGEDPYFKRVIYLTGWIIYPILGVISKDDWVIRAKKPIFAAGIFCAVLNCTMVVTDTYLAESTDVLAFSPLMIIEILALFRAFLEIKIKESKSLRFLSARTFTAYLVGPYTTFLLEKRLGGFFTDTVPGMLLSILLLTIVTFVLAIVCDLLILRYLEKFLNFLINLLEKGYVRIAGKIKK